jgi:hypothetical protein
MYVDTGLSFNQLRKLPKKPRAILTLEPTSLTSTEKVPIKGGSSAKSKGGMIRKMPIRIQGRNKI